MKLIGGPCDGRNYAVGPQERDAVFPVMEPIPASEMRNLNAETVTNVRYVRYSRRALQFAEGQVIYFMAPDTMSDYEAICHQFSK